MDWVGNSDVRLSCYKFEVIRIISPHYIFSNYVTRDLVGFVMHCDLEIVSPLLKIFQISISHIFDR